MIYRLLVTLLFTNLSTSAAMASDCLREVFTLVSKEDFSKAKKMIRKSGCDLEFTDEFGDSKEFSKSEILNIISRIQSAHVSCDKVYKNYISKAPSLRSPRALKQRLERNCGPESSGYQAIIKMQKFTGENYWENNRWTKLIAEEEKSENKRLAAEDLEQKTKEKQKADYEKSSKYSLDESCYANKRVLLAKKAIENERGAASHSGVIDKARLHKLGQQVQTFQKLLNSHSQEYKDRSGKAWNPSMCE